MNIEPLRNHVIFEFTDGVTNTGLVSTVGSGIILSNDSELHDQGVPRWGKVIAIGPDVKEETIIVGNFILIEPLKWTTSLVVDNQKLWKTDENHIMCTSEVEHLRY